MVYDRAHEDSSIDCKVGDESKMRNSELQTIRWRYAFCYCSLIFNIFTKALGHIISVQPNFFADAESRGILDKRRRRISYRKNWS